MIEFLRLLKPQAHQQALRHWFANQQHIGSGPHLAWQPPPGAITLRCMDDQGRSHAIHIQVDAQQPVTP